MDPLCGGNGELGMGRLTRLPLRGDLLLRRSIGPARGLPRPRLALVKTPAQRLHQVDDVAGLGLRRGRNLLPGLDLLLDLRVDPLADLVLVLVGPELVDRALID